MKVPGIYKIQSKAKPDRIYIGSAVNLKHRWISHQSDLRLNKHVNRKLQNHYNKYGVEDLVFSVLLVCEKENLIQNEQYYLDSHKTYFNLCPIAGNNLGMKWSSESRHNLCVNWKPRDNKRKGAHLTEETKQKLREANLGKKASKETKEKISIALKGRACSEETKRKISARHKGRVSPNKGKPMSEEQKNKLRIINKGQIITEEQRRKLSISLKGNIPWNKGKKLSEEHVKKLSDSHKNYIMPQAQRDNISKALIGKKKVKKAK